MFGVLFNRLDQPPRNTDALTIVFLIVILLLSLRL